MPTDANSKTSAPSVYWEKSPTPTAASRRAMPRPAVRKAIDSSAVGWRAGRSIANAASTPMAAWRPPYIARSSMVAVELVELTPAASAR